MMPVMDPKPDPDGGSGSSSQGFPDTQQPSIVLDEKAKQQLRAVRKDIYVGGAWGYLRGAVIMVPIAFAMRRYPQYMPKFVNNQINNPNPIKRKNAMMAYMLIGGSSFALAGSTSAGVRSFEEFKIMIGHDLIARSPFLQSLLDVETRAQTTFDRRNEAIRKHQLEQQQQEEIGYSGTKKYAQHNRTSNETPSDPPGYRSY